MKLSYLTAIVIGTLCVSAGAEPNANSTTTQAPSAEASAVPNSVAAEDQPGPDDISPQFGWTPGVTSLRIVGQKFGQPRFMNSAPNHHVVYVYKVSDGRFVSCLFDSSGMLVRTRVLTPAK